MPMHTFLSQKHKCPAPPHVNQANRRRVLNAMSESDLVRSALNRSVNHQDTESFRNLLENRLQGSQRKAILIGLQQRFGNQATLSALAAARMEPKRSKGGCSCGGSCGSCSQNKAGEHVHRKSPKGGCSCGGSCGSCSQNKAEEHVHRKPPDEELEMNPLLVHRADPFSAMAHIASRYSLSRPVGAPAGDGLVHQGSATVVCDGSGDYRVDMGWAASATCGLGDCIRRHEESHITDLRARYPDGCKNADGTPKPDGTPHPTGGSGYADFLKQTECKAYTTEIACEEALLSGASAACQPTVQTVLDDSKKQKKRFCSGGC